MQRVSMQLVHELEAREDVDIETVILHAPWKGIEVKTAFFLAKLSFTLPFLVKKHKPNVILFSSMVTASLAKITRSRIDVPMVTINHGQDVKMPVKVYQRFVPKVFEALDGVISVSAATREECIKRGMDPEKGVALPNGFDMSDFKEVPDRKRAAQHISETFGVDLEKNHLLLTVGRQVKRKGHAWFIDKVMPLIKSDVVYLAIGDGPEHEALKRMVRQSSQKDDIILAGRQPDDLLKQAYAAADLFIMPNIPVEGDMEGFGIVLLEANLAGTPAVAADLEGIKDVIQNGANGFKVPVYEAETFASTIDEVLKDNLGEFGNKARNYVRENFSWHSVADRYISYLRQVIQKNHSRL